MALLDSSYISKLREHFRALEDKKDLFKQTAIKVNRRSKEVIYALIRDDWARAEEARKEMHELLNWLRNELKDEPRFIGMALTSFQEYAEAEILYSYLKFKKIPTHEDLQIDEDCYIQGLADFCGELLRKSVEEMIKGNIDFAKESKNAIEEIYLSLLSLELKNFELRKKIDYVGNVLNRLTDYIFQKTTFSNISQREK
ncbi:MAG TPA: haloacid dehalogenase [Desulfurobacteriaceae bacterium]|nr:haloacid dehalogenase [Desulfurobacteriaceae bacterium]